jgi:hypothetical protein
MEFGKIKVNSRLRMQNNTGKIKIILPKMKQLASHYIKPLVR